MGSRFFSSLILGKFQGAVAAQWGLSLKKETGECVPVSGVGANHA